MSADLLAEFDSFYQPARSSSEKKDETVTQATARFSNSNDLNAQHHSNQHVFDTLNTPVTNAAASWQPEVSKPHDLFNPVIQNDDDNDDWGDFEDGSKDNVDARAVSQFPQIHDNQEHALENTHRFQEVRDFTQTHLGVNNKSIQNDIWGGFDTFGESSNQANQLQVKPSQTELPLKFKEDTAKLDDPWGSFDAYDQQPRLSTDKKHENAWQAFSERDISQHRSSHIKPDANTHPLSLENSSHSTKTEPPQTVQKHAQLKTKLPQRQPVDAKDSEWQSSHNSPRTLGKDFRSEDVLFDAEDEQEDDFGDFEGAEGVASRPLTPPLKVVMLPIERPAQTKAPVQKKNLPNLLDLDVDSSTNDATSGLHANAVLSPIMTPSIRSSSPQGTLEEQTWPSTTPGSTTPSVSHEPHSQIEVNEDEGWDDFETPTVNDHTTSKVNDFQAAFSDDSPWTQPSPPPPPSQPSPLDLPTVLPDNEEGQKSEAAPTNIPPPAMLLPLFPPLLQLIQDKLFEPIAGHAGALATRTAILSHPTTQKFLSSYLGIGTVLARIIAGRKLRWKRDTILAQSTRIGPASGKSGGMKLTGLDKAESTREEREVTEVVRRWKAQAGKLRSAVAGAGISTALVPDVAEALPVRTAAQHEGAATAPRQCALCGLKRNERIAKVDVDVQDSFGEWWVEHWGHRTCTNFWQAHKDKLSMR